MRAFNLYKNNCWHQLCRDYEAFWGVPIPVFWEGENPSKILEIHRGALRLVEFFGLSSCAENGCIVLLSGSNVIHHFGFYKDGRIITFSERGLMRLSEDDLVALNLKKIQYLKIGRAKIC